MNNRYKVKKLSNDCWAIVDKWTGMIETTAHHTEHQAKIHCTINNENWKQHEFDFDEMLQSLPLERVEILILRGDFDD